MTTMAGMPEARSSGAVQADDFSRLRRMEMRARLVTAGVPLIERLTDRPPRPDDGPPAADRDILSDLAYEIEVYLRGLSVPQLVCLSYGHKWPELVPGTRIPKGFRATSSPRRNGVYLITESCVRETADGICGTRRVSQTLPGTVRGIFDRGRGRNYDYDGSEWEVRPAGSRLTRIDFLNEVWRRMGSELFPEIIAGAQS